MKLLKQALLLFAAFLLLLVLFGEMIGRGLSLQAAAINNRLQSGQLTTFDKLQCRLLYNSMIYAGGVAYPEAAAILEHYIYGQGKDLYLAPDYLKTSPVIVRNLNDMRVGESRRVGLKQHEDWRLSYAVNGFTLTKKKHKAELSQLIVFSRNKRIFTDLNFYFFKVRVTDGLVHSLKPTPFTVYAEWEL